MFGEAASVAAAQFEVLVSQSEQKRPVLNPVIAYLLFKAATCGFNYEAASQPLHMESQFHLNDNK